MHCDVEGLADPHSHHGVEDNATEEEGEEEGNRVHSIEAALLFLEDEKKLSEVEEEGRELIDQEHVLSSF